MSEKHCLVLIKPDAIKRRLTGEIVARFERAGLVVQEMIARSPTPDMVRAHYSQLNNEVLIGVIDYFCSTKHEDGRSIPVIAIVFFGNNAIEICRKLVGVTQCSFALPGTIRGDFGNESYQNRKNLPMKRRAIRNLVHASDSPHAYEREYNVWFRFM